MDQPSILNRAQHTALNHSLGIQTLVSSQEHEDLLDAPGVNPKLLLVQEDVTEQFWTRGYQETRNWCWILIGLRFPFEVAYMLNPMNESQFWTLLAFSSLSSLLIVLQFASYKVKSKANKGLLIYIVLCLMNVRVSLVFLDLEEVKHLVDDPERPGRKNHFDWA